MDDKPIVVNPNPVPAGLSTLLRYILTAVGGLLVSKGYFTDDTINDLIGAVLIIGPTIYGVWKTFSNKKKLVTAAAAAPNDVAVVQ